MASISLVSLNIERSNHLDLVVPFLLEKKPDVVALQEVMARDVPLFEKALGMKSIYTPLCFWSARSYEVPGEQGQAIFARDFITTGESYYAGEHDPIPTFTEEKLVSIVKIAKALTYADIQKDGKTFRVVTTHFTWSERGEVSELQRVDLLKLFEKLAPLSEFVLSGDFNAPRGRAIYDAIAGKFKDNIPHTYTTSIDGNLHRAGALPYMIDGLFTTKDYIASDVVLHAGVSDHMALTATITKL